MFGGVPIAKELIMMIRVYHTPVTNPSSTDTSSSTTTTAVTDSVICWTCLGLTVSTGKYMIIYVTGI